MSKQLHAVGVPGERRTVVKDDVRLRVEGERRKAARRDGLVLRQPLQNALRLVRVHVARVLPGEAKRDGPVRGVALAGEGQRAMQRTGKARRLPGAWNAVGSAAERVKKHARRRHRPHRVR